MSVADRCLEKARASLSFGHYALAGDYAEAAGRAAYMAAYHAAQALIVSRTGRQPKTHSGTRSEFTRLVRGDSRVSRDQISLLGWSYELKSSADYGHEQTISCSEAQRALDEVDRLIETIAAILP